MPRASRRDWVALGVLVLPVLLISVDMTVLGFALPYLSEDLAPTGAQQLWIVDIYSFVLAGLLVLMGSLGDRIGRRKLLLAGAFAFGAASVLAAFADSAELLIVARALLGLGGATLMPSTLSLLRSIFTDADQRRVAIGVWSAGFSGGMALGPVIGGWLLEHFHWGSVFLINVPVMVLLLVLGPILLPEAADPNPGRFDPLSAVLSLATTLPVVYGIKTMAKEGIEPTGVAAVLAGLAFGAWFVRRQTVLADPMIDLSLFRRRAFGASVLTNLLSVLAFTGLMLLTPQYLQLVLGLRPFEAALWMLPATAAGVLGAVAAAQAPRWFAPPKVICTGLLLAAAGLLALLGTGVVGGLPVLVASFVLMGAGVSLADTLTNDLIISTAPPERAGAASAISETAFELGGAMGVAVIGTVAGTVYSAGLPEQADPVARETLGGAVAVAQTLPAEQGAALLDAARTAFVDGMHIAAAVGAALLVYAGTQAAILLRNSARAKAEERAA
ncbi:MFS transporter [Amycolatopsis suaedae]|uniref:MFS transporter n=1 Tax=Amycolatopsis suaedae TaxID=2510978 RepID=A0A4Q7JBL8_9PSEU|nr:MFS transporter [Amycolatopsis suaedae]RZQ65221.1 MFS transporter [Amycolatopsis suaedae]